MIEQINNPLTFLAFYTSLGIGQPSMTGVIVDIYRNGVEIIASGTVVEMSDGLYRYVLPSGSVNQEGDYVALFKSPYLILDQQQMTTVWYVNKAGVENLDVPVSSRMPTGTITLSTGTIINDPRFAYLDAYVSSRASAGSPIAIPNNVTTNKVTAFRGDTWNIQLTGIGSLTGRTKLYFTVKARDNHPDTQALVQVEESAGLIYINSQLASTPANATVTVTDAVNGNATITVSGVETAKLPPVDAGFYDVQMISASGVVTKAYGQFSIPADITRSTS